MAQAGDGECFFSLMSRARNCFAASRTSQPRILSPRHPQHRHLLAALQPQDLQCMMRLTPFQAQRLTTAMFRWQIKAVHGTFT